MSYGRGINAIMSNRARDAIILIILFRGIREWREGGTRGEVGYITVITIIVRKSARGVMSS